MAYWGFSAALSLFVLLHLYQEAKTQAAGTLVAIATAPVQHRHRRDTTQNDNPKPDVQSLHVDSVVLYRYANTEVYSRISNEAGVAQQVYFTALLPDNAFISGFAITTGQTVYKGYVTEKGRARIVYEDAIIHGRTAGHVELSARDSNMFRVSMNVEAYGRVSFNMTYEELLVRELGAYSLKINVVAEQIIKEMQVQIRIQDNANITLLEVFDLRTSNEIEEHPSVNPQTSVWRPSGNSALIKWVPTPEQQTAISEDGVRGLLEVRYDVDRTKHSNEILMNNGYFVHFFAPQNLAPLKKHVVFVLDRSNSMEGRKLKQLKAAMMSIIDDLAFEDTFSLIVFASEIKVWTTSGDLVDIPNINRLAIASATIENREAAKNMINVLNVDGATYIYDALQAALQVVVQGKHLALELEDSMRQPMIIFLTDGQPTGKNAKLDKILNVTSTKNKEIGAVIHSLAFGKDADFKFLKKLSLQNNGFARKIYEDADASLQLTNFYKSVASPLLANVTFHYIGREVNLSSLTMTHFPLLYNGSELAVAGHYQPLVEWNGEVSSTSQFFRAKPVVLDGGWYPERLSLVQNGSEATFMERLWAYLTIRQLLDQAEQDETSKHRALEIALKYGFVTPVTSLVVVKPDSTSKVDLREVRNQYIHSFAFHPSHSAAANNDSKWWHVLLFAVIQRLKANTFYVSHTG
ncbi:inter-alpha-trypsin inhibitor heavy chain H4 isoform X2 [Anabrus simplex]|uniref:inter-alpha-trypsin inhibitor heavy chain H4 isoform X2 n=1 Tax=Anabrus simplex TaxID=316456 RepID=UPI0035A26851